MPDNDDYDYLYKLGDNSYASPWGSSDFGRSLFGLPQEPRALQSQEEVNVTAPRPPADAPYPSNLDEIYLGTRTAPPTGTYTPPLREKPVVDPRIAPGWGRMIERYPYAQNLVNAVEAKPLMPSKVGSYNHYNNAINIDENWGKDRENLESTLAHELAHAAQNKQFPERERNAEHYGSFFTPHDQRPGEQLADAVEIRSVNRGRREEGQASMAAMDAKRWKEDDDFFFNNGPAPNWYVNYPQSYESMRKLALARRSNKR